MFLKLAGINLDIVGNSPEWALMGLAICILRSKIVLEIKWICPLLTQEVCDRKSTELVENVVFDSDYDFIAQRTCRTNP